MADVPSPTNAIVQPLVPNLGQMYGAGVQSGAQIAAAPYLVQQQAAEAQTAQAQAQQEKLKAFLQFAGPDSYATLTAPDEQKADKYQSFLKRVRQLNPDIASNMPTQYGPQAQQYLMETYQESQTIDQLMQHNLMAGAVKSAGGPDISNIYPGASPANFGPVSKQGGVNWPLEVMAMNAPRGVGYNLSKLGVEGGMQDIRSQYDLVKVTEADGTEYYVPKSQVLGNTPGGPQPTLQGNQPTTQPVTQPTTGGQPSKPLPVMGGPTQAYVPDTGTVIPGAVAPQGNVAGMSPAAKKLQESSADAAFKWIEDVNKQAAASKQLGASLDAAQIALNGFNPSAAESTRAMLQKAANFITGGTYTGELGSITEFNKAMMNSVTQSVRETSARAAVQEFNMIKDTFPNINFPDKDTAEFLINTQRAAKVDMPQMAQQFSQKWAAMHPNTGIIGAQEKWNQYADPVVIALMRMPQDKVNQIIQGLNKTPEGRAQVKRMLDAEAFFSNAGLQ